MELVNDLDQVIRNIQQYNRELKEGKMTLRTNGVQRWYYIHELKLFGPSRYIGYQNVTIEKHSNAYLHGGETTNALKKWFIECEDEEVKNILTEKLLDYLESFEMDVRRNSTTKQPSFKLHILEEDIPLIKSFKVEQDLISFTCSTCNRIIYEEPFYAHNNRGPFCSQKCLPHDISSQKYALEYVIFLKHYRSFKNAFHEISNITMQQDLLDKLYILLEEIEVYLEKEHPSVYLSFIKELCEKFLDLRDDIEFFYIDEEHLDIQKAVVINWPLLDQDNFSTFELEALLNSIKITLNDLDTYQLSPNDRLEVTSSSPMIIYFTEEDVSIKTDQALDTIYSYFVKFLDKQSLTYDLNNYINNTLIATCPKCEETDLLTNFTVIDRLFFTCSKCK